MATAFCPFCGAALAGINAVYCPRCGKQLPEVAPTSTGQTAPTQAPVAGQPDASAPPQSPIYPSAPSGGYQATPAQYAPPPGAAPSYAAPQPYMAPAAGGGAVGQLYVMAPQSPVTPGRAVGTTAALCAIALVLAAVGVILSPVVLLRDYTLVLIPATAWTLVAAFWLATRLLARQSFGIVLVENAALCLILLLLLPVLDATIFAVVFRLNVRDILRFQSLV